MHAMKKAVERMFEYLTEGNVVFQSARYRLREDARAISKKTYMYRRISPFQIK